jgi:hypothetical protein
MESFNPAQYKSDSEWYRGNFISEFSGLEMAIERLLITYFIKDGFKKVEFVEIILDRLTFEAKRTSAKVIAEKQCIKTGFIKTGKNSWPFKKLFDEINSLNSHRISFAHYRDTIPSSFNDSVIGLISNRDSSKVIWYTKIKYNEHIRHIRKCKQQILDMESALDSAL